MGKMKSRIDSIAYTRYTIWFQLPTLHDSIQVGLLNS